MNDSCTASSECLTTLGLICSSSICTCSSIYYWSGSTCTLKNSIYYSCNDNSYCSNTLSLYCINGICNCLNSTFWSGTSCGKLDFIWDMK
jgi:hypothetical protein